MCLGAIVRRLLGSHDLFTLHEHEKKNNKKKNVRGESASAAMTLMLFLLMPTTSSADSNVGLRSLRFLDADVCTQSLS